MLQELQDFADSLRMRYGTADLNISIGLPTELFLRLKQECFRSKEGEAGNVNAKTFVVHTASGKAKVIDNGNR